MDMFSVKYRMGDERHSFLVLRGNNFDGITIGALCGDLAEAAKFVNWINERLTELQTLRGRK